MLLMLLWERLEVTLYQLSKFFYLSQDFDQTVQIDGIAAAAAVVVITAAVIAATESSNNSNIDRGNN